MASEKNSAQNLVTPSPILSFTDNFMSTSNDRLVGNNNPKSTPPDKDGDILERDGLMAKVGRRASQMGQYLLKYIKVEETPANNPETQFETNNKTDAVKIASYWGHTIVNATYNYRENELELGWSNAVINQYLIDGMTLEIQANPKTGSGALIFSIGF